MSVSKVRFESYLVSRRFPDALLYSGAATTASRLGQPDLAIATLNDFVGVRTEPSSLISPNNSLTGYDAIRQRKWSAVLTQALR